MTATLDQPVKAPTFQRLSLRRKVADNVATVLVTLSVAIALVPLIWVLYTVVVKGIGAVTSSTWWFQLAGRHDGLPGRAAARITRSSEPCCRAWCVPIISIPIGVFVGIYLVEYGGGTKLGKITTFMVDILTGVPSIVAALFIYALWVATLGFQRSGFAVSLALVLLMIPVIVRSTEEMLRIVPMDLREASYALGVPKWRTISSIVIPTALSGIVTGILLALARVMGETAPLLILVGYAAGDELRHVQRVHGIAARHDVRPDLGRRGRESGSDGSALGCGVHPDRADRAAQHRRALHRQVLFPQEGLGVDRYGQAP